MDSLSNITNSKTIEALSKVDSNVLTNTNQDLFLSTMLANADSSTTNSLFTTLFSKQNNFNTAIFSAIENNDFDGLHTLSLIANLGGLRMLASSSTQSNYDMLYDNYIQKEVINDLEEKLDTIDDLLSKTENEELRATYEEEYKIYSKVLEKYKEFRADDEKVLAQMMQLSKGSALLS